MMVFKFRWEAAGLLWIVWERVERLSRRVAVHDRQARRIFDVLFFRQVVANSRRHPQDVRMPAEVVAETDHDTRSSVLWQIDPGQTPRAGGV